MAREPRDKLSNDEKAALREVLETTDSARDALPYTEEFDRLHKQFCERTSRDDSQAEFWRYASNLEKKGGWSGRQRGSPAPDLTIQQSDILRGLFKGKLGQRDSLVYTKFFDEIHADLNKRTGLSLSRHDLWRAICNLGKRSLKPEVKALFDRSLASLLLAIEHFNRPSELGRKESVLMLLDHAFEMLLKAALVHRGAAIREHRRGHTLTFESCLNKATDDASVKFLAPESRRTLAVLNGLRDQAQHHLVEVSEQMLYTVAQSAVTLFRDSMSSVFDKSLADFVPERVLPISTSPPQDMTMLMDREYAQLRELLSGGTRTATQADAKLRSLVTIDRALQEKDTHIGDADLEALRKSVKKQPHWSLVFAGVAQVQLDTSGTGVHVSIHFTKKDGAPMRLVSEDDPEVAGVPAIAIRRVNELDHYSLSPTALARKVGLSQPKALAVVRHLGIRDDPECYKEFAIGKTRHKRYSALAMKQIVQALPDLDMEEIWRKHGPRIRRKG